MMLTSEQALRLFLLTGLPQAYTYAAAARRRERKAPPRDPVHAGTPGRERPR